ncbi:ABC-type nitrate/sulfonate/bicarbonate transport system, permease component [Hoeflea sp. IMCC20628]|uniref:ABC transporter permease n=1 Tax=Hoeflea sp. IMCC20628 TaxID=1620421 RepID=UPI00063A905A|nr:ABC transporter permease [Hoeflea sp. IMCC20628]AKI01801.1 ABC-type nitrate/sulfonate/bicarbonate transport system, permease component [Hoeflea sp. IMCC20628]
MNFNTSISRIGEPALWFLGLLLVWEAAVRVFAVPSFILPAPSVFLLRIVESAPQLAYHGMITTKLIIYGFVAGAVPGIGLGYLIARFRICKELLYPIVVFIQGLPKITLAPLMLVWFGFADFPKILLTGLITFFPVMVDSVAGFQAIDPRKYYLSKSTGASWLQTFLKIELPSAAPNIFSGLRISIVVAVTVVIVVEWLNSKDGLGYLVLRAMDSNDTSMIFAVLVVGSMIGVILNGLMQAIERHMVPRGPN